MTPKELATLIEEMLGSVPQVPNELVLDNIANSFWDIFSHLSDEEMVEQIEHEYSYALSSGTGNLWLMIAASREIGVDRIQQFVMSKAIEYSR